ncbi:hypothetical protein ACI79C_23300 [Geodermatophilus sp. SYSU D00697]
MSLPEGGSAPLFIVPFDEEGVCSGPRTCAALVERVATGEPSHVFVFSHGWNNDWPSAIDKYTRFIEGFARTRAAHPVPGRFRPVLAGIFWPSAVLVREQDRAPVIAGGDPTTDEDGMRLAELTTVAGQVTPARRERFYELAQSPGITTGAALELADVLTPVWGGRPGDAGDVDELLSHPDLRADELVTLWQRVEGLAADAGQFAGGAPQGTPAGEVPPGPFAAGPDAVSVTTAAAGPAPAGLLDRLTPRNIIRAATVLLMKDRAGRVGARGVSRLLEDVLAATTAPVHLVGHSYGCKVVMSALCRVSDRARPVESALLLQPAMSHLAFARDVPGLGGPGGYRPALGRSVQPIRATFSRHDEPLTTFFHLAVRRASDLGEVQIAGAPPSRYSAMGGFGPSDGPEVVHLPAESPGERYGSPAGARVVGVEASTVISSHSDINNPATWWMLMDQVLGKS